MNNIPYMDVRIFVTAARLLSFVSTARELGMSQAYVSKRIALLEKALGHQLFHRRHRRIDLSEEGQWILPRAKRVLTAYAELADVPSTDTEGARGALTITASAALGRNHVAPIISQIAIHNPELELRLEIVDRPVNLVEEDVDVDIRIGQVNEQHLYVQTRIPSSRILCAAPSFIDRHGMPTQLADLARLPCLQIRERYNAHGRWLMENQASEVETVEISAQLSSNDGEIVRHWAIAGRGVMLRSHWDIAHELATGSLVRLLPNYAQRADISIVSKLRTFESYKLRRCIDALRAGLETTLGGAFAP